MIRLVSMLRGGLATLAIPAMLSVPAAVQEPDVADAATSERDSVAFVPFGPGERAEYQVRLGRVAVGSGSMEVLDVENIRGHRTYHTRMQVAGGIPFARVDNTLESWIDVGGLFSRRFKQDQKEVRFERKRTFDFFPEERRYERLDNGESGDLPTDRPLDEVSFLYHVRTMDLEVGKTYRLDQYFQESGNPVVLEVLRRETVEVPAGMFQTIVVRPIIQTSGLFGEGGEAEVYFTDDDRRLLVQMRSRVPVVGSLNLRLREYEPGQRLSATPSSGAASRR